MIVWMIKAVQTKNPGKPEDWNLWEKTQKKKNPTKIDRETAWKLAKASFKGREEIV